jgi:hypothetical protein
MAKARCPGCGAGMKAKRRFCGECGRQNPLFAPKAARAAKSAAPLTLVKSAQQINRDHWMREMHAANDPERQAQFWNMAHPELSGPKGAA